MSQETSFDSLINGKQGFNDVVFYTVEVDNAEMTRKIMDLKSEILKKEKEIKELAREAAKAIHVPRGWDYEIQPPDSSARVEVRVYHHVSRTTVGHSQPSATTSKPISKIQKLLNIMDAKTLFNSGALTKEQKAEFIAEIIND